MTTRVAAKTLRPQDLFELLHESVYETIGSSTEERPAQARLWCVHSPDTITADPPLIDLLPEQPVQLLSRDESRDHSRHGGYVRAAFEQDMDRHHHERMNVVYKNINQENAAARLRDRAHRPWWKNLFA